MGFSIIFLFVSAFMCVLVFDCALEGPEKTPLLDQVKLRDELLEHAYGIVFHSDSHLTAPMRNMINGQTDINQVQRGLTQPSFLVSLILIRYLSPICVLVVIAILAIAVFRPKLQELWDAIASGINGL